MVSNTEGREAKSKGRQQQRWNYLTTKKAKKLSESLRGITTKNRDDFYCRNCFHSFTTKNKLQLHKRVCENRDFCNVIMSSEDAKILEFLK